MIFNPNDRRSVQNPQSGGTNISVAKQVINSIFGRRPTFFNAGLGEQIHPIVDSTLYYPLKPIVKEETRDTVAAGTIHQFQFKPKTGYHWMVMFLTVGMDGEDTGGPNGLGEAELSLQIAPASTFQLLNSQLFPSTLPSGFSNTLVATLIGSKRSGVDNVTVVGQPYFYNYEGIKSLYLSSDMTMVILMNQLAMVIQGRVKVTYTYLELPESQPFGPAITI